MVTGMESNGTLNDQNPLSTASGLFQFLDTTWDNYDGIGHAGDASFQQQVGKYLQETAGNNFYAWAPDLGSSYNGSGSLILNSVPAGSHAAGYLAQDGTLTASTMTQADWQALYQAGQGPGGQAVTQYLEAANQQAQAATAASGAGGGSQSSVPSSTEIAGQTYVGTAQQTSALSTISANLGNYGFSPTQIQQLTSWAWGEITNNVDPTQIAIDLQNQPAFQQQFPFFNQVNQALESQGQGALSVSNYMSLTQQYLQTAQAAGLPPGMLTGQDMATLMEGNVSANELSARVNSAVAYTLSTPAAQEAFNQYFGTSYGDNGTGTPLSLGQMAAIVLNPKVAEPLIQQQLTTAQIGGASVTSGVGALDAKTATELAQAGITPSQATSAFQSLAPYSTLETARPGMENVSQGVVSPEQLVTGQLLGNPQGQRQLQTAIEVAKAPFSGGGGFVQNAKGVAGAGSASSTGAGNT